MSNSTFNHHQLLRAASLPTQGRLGLSLQLHMPYLVSASMRRHWALPRPTRGVCWESSISGTGAGKGDASPTLRFPTFSWFPMEKAPGTASSLEKSMSINAHGQGGRSQFWFHKNYRHSGVGKAYSAVCPIAQLMPPGAGLLRAGSLGALWLLLIWFKHHHPVLCK